MPSAVDAGQRTHPKMESTVRCNYTWMCMNISLAIISLQVQVLHQSSVLSVILLSGIDFYSVYGWAVASYLIKWKDNNPSLNFCNMRPAASTEKITYVASWEKENHNTRPHYLPQTMSSLNPKRAREGNWFVETLSEWGGKGKRVRQVGVGWWGVVSEKKIHKQNWLPYFQLCMKAPLSDTSGHEGFKNNQTDLAAYSSPPISLTFVLLSGRYARTT